MTTLSDTELVSYQTLLSAYKDNFNSFLDFYDYDYYVGNQFYLYQDKENTNRFYQLLIKALNENPELRELKSYEEQKAKVKHYQVTGFEKTTNSEKQEYTLKVNLEDLSTKTNTSLEFVANKANDFSPKGFDEFVEALGYKGGMDPVSLFYTPVDIQAKDSQGKPLAGLDARTYQVYVSAYNNLIKKVVQKYPHLLRDLNGPHVAKTLNADGSYQYQVVEGPFKGFTPSDRIGLPVILSAFVPDFNGLPIDFLKYVATHEYGHHYTLDQGRAFIDKDNPVLVSGLSTRNGASEASFFSYQALLNYLDARTNLEVIRVNANNEVTPTGKFLRFKFGILDENGNLINYETEKFEDIWGLPSSNDNISEVLKNKKRQFLQDFAGLTEAAKLRHVALSDLFFANSFDSDSETLNP